MRTSSDLVVDVRRSWCLTAGLSGFVAGATVSIYLAASVAVGSPAAAAVALAGAVGLAAAARRQMCRQPRAFTLAADGAVDGVARDGRRFVGHVVGAGRVGGLWVSLRVSPARASRRGVAGWRGGFARRAWLIPADALDAETFRQLAVRVPRLLAGTAAGPA
jgi:hypothetical protein